MLALEDASGKKRLVVAGTREPRGARLALDGKGRLRRGAGGMRGRGGVQVSGACARAVGENPTKLEVWA